MVVIEMLVNTQGLNPDFSQRDKKRKSRPKKTGATRSLETKTSNRLGD
jgi:hypothetical protein